MVAFLKGYLEVQSKTFTLSSHFREKSHSKMKQCYGNLIRISDLSHSNNSTGRCEAMCNGDDRSDNRTSKLR